MKIRVLHDRTEFYQEDISGRCICGAAVTKIIGSSITNRKDGVRYAHDIFDPSCLFRCGGCYKVITESFRETF